MTTYLTKILEHKAGEVDVLKQQGPAARYHTVEKDLPPARGFKTTLQNSQGEIRLIAEVKKASPSRGVMVENFQPLDIARRYAEIGASAFSVLTDRNFFQGANEYLQQISAAFDLPVLRKDFIIDESQIYEARLIGADAVLLIVAALDTVRLRDYLQLVEGIGLDALVEVHDHAELDRALDAGAAVIGVNNRNLNDFTVSLDTSLRLRPSIPQGVVAVAESGLKRASDVAMMQDASFDAVLIGEGLLGPELQRFTWKRT
ncbi:indole-3-glycerol phosphate synthase TrpC [Prosthecochloris sp. SCSIO W1101]|uniref:indole-3-glycerol phosphate synthase TrpC n=1 Tax=Prosthecochloris sp. SCSIO W1101 TaxID=2992242 RepID=UPI00223CD810|nr:indole-3-glycerol phosphate synthase TrpC [Prosthecochloris sp. SCSIO W1101]UZJ40903.1 indole-3-glycerol phosphate synthase TrpC [Prosthecochloris sp. SCSIO W1101]